MDITKPNVVRRINFEDPHGIPAKEKINKHGSDRTRFMQSLKEKIKNAKAQKQTETRRYVTRSSVKKNTERISQADLGPNTPNHTKLDTCDEYGLKEDSGQKQCGHQNFADHHESAKEVLGNTDCVVQGANTPNHTQLDTCDENGLKEDSDRKQCCNQKLAGHQENAEEVLENADRAPQGANTPNHTHLDTCDEYGLKKDSDRKKNCNQEVADHQRKAEGVSSSIIVLQEDLRNDSQTTFQNHAPDKSTESDPDQIQCFTQRNTDNNASTSISSINIGSKIMRNDDPAFRVQQNTPKFIDQMPFFAQSFDDDASIHVSPFNIDLQEEINNDPVLRDLELTDFVHQKFQEMDIGPKNEIHQKVQHKDGYCSSGGGSFELNNSQFVEVIVHTNNLIETPMEQNVSNSQPGNDNVEISSPQTDKYNEAQFKLSASPLLLENDIPEQKVAMLRHASSSDYLGILSSTNKTMHVNKTKPEQTISPTTNEMELITNYTAEEKSIKTMKRRDFFNKENNLALNDFPDEKKVKVINSKVIIPDKRKIQKKEKNKRKKEIIDALQVVHLNDKIMVSNKQVSKEIISKDEGLDKIPYEKKKGKIVKKQTKTTDIQTKPDQILTRKRKKENEKARTEEKEIKLVITPIKMCDSELTSNSPNKKKKKDQVNVSKELIDCDIQEDEIVNSDTGKPFLRKKNIKRSYIDFLSDDEDFEWSSSSWEGPFDSDTETDTKTKKKLKRKSQQQNDNVCDVQNSETNLLDLRTKKKRRNMRAVRQLSKERGEEYMTRKGKNVPGKYVKANPCAPENCSYACFEISEERRQNLFRHYWSLSAARKRDWLISNSTKNDVKRKRTDGLSRRTGTFQYFINEGEGKKTYASNF